MRINETEEKAKVSNTRIVEYDDYMAEGKALFGDDVKDWKFVCPSCKTSQCARDFLDKGIEKDVIAAQLAFSCIGRSVKGVGCNWTLGGFFSIHTLEIMKDGESHPRFEFDKSKTNSSAIPDGVS